MEYDFSIVIPALREEFISNTVENIIKNKRGKTEVIVVLDGEWAEPGIMDHPDVRVIKLGKNLGQRGATNVGVKLSRAKYVAKTDAHVAFDEGFDVKLMDALKGHDDWTIVPSMKNLHVFNSVCSGCGTEYYQGDRPEKCMDEMCQFEERTWEKKIYFIPRDMSDFKKRRGPTSTAYRFTPDELQFKYFGALKRWQDKEPGPIKETMSLQGSFFMLTREKYWELNICDESWGGWGQQGTEVALKTWLSGGRVVVHTGTWYAHMFRTNDQIAFPWNGNGISQGSQQRSARKACVELFKKNQWDKQRRPLSWLVERFWEPLQAEGYNPKDGDRPWSQQDLEALKATEGRFSESPSRGIIFYTDNRLQLSIARPVQKQLLQISRDKRLPITSASLKPMAHMGNNVRLRLEPSYLTMFKQILTALENSTTDIVYFCEHDVLYPPEHFDFIPPSPDKFYYNLSWWKIRQDGLAVHWDAVQVSGLVCYRDLAIKFYKERIATFDIDSFDRKFEPTVDTLYETFTSSVPLIDIRHSRNTTYNKWKLAHFRKKETAVNFKSSTIDQIEGWNLTTKDIY